MKGKVLRTIRNIFDGLMIFLLFITTTVYALPSDGVIYDNSTSGSSATNVDDALNDLYSKLNEKQNEINNINNIGTAGANHILSGYTAYVKGKTVTGTIPNKGATTYTPNTKDQTIASGQYLSGTQTIKGDANLIAANIAKGKSIFGISGSYTSDANAAAGNILSGKTAYVNGSKITGTIASKGATTYTPGTVNQTIAAGNYLSGIQTIKGDANLIAANIAQGKTIFGVNGTYTSDATAAAGNILSGKTAYVNGSKITGSMPSRNGSSAATVVSTGTSGLYMTFPYGYYPAESHFNQANSSEVYISNDKVASAIGLTAAKLAKGQTVLGVAGSYTSDATATAANILKDKTAYVNGSKITGTIPSKAAATYTPGTSNQTIASGNYLSGAQTIKGDANLVASNIAKGKTIFGVTGTYGGMTVGKTMTSVKGAKKTSVSLTVPSGVTDGFVIVNAVTTMKTTVSSTLSGSAIISQESQDMGTVSRGDQNAYSNIKIYTVSLKAGETITASITNYYSSSFMGLNLILLAN